MSESESEAAVTAYNPAEIERLIAEAREDDARMDRGVWIVSDTPLGWPIHEIVTPHSVFRIPIRNAVPVARTRNNLPAMADQLSAARDEVAISNTERDAARWADDTRRKACEALIKEKEAARARIAELEAAVDRMAPVVRAAEAYRDDGAVGAGIVSAVDTYRASKS